MGLHKHQTTRRQGKRGQVMPLFVFFVIALILMVGLGIDLGLAYTTKAQLSKGVDAACLAGLAHLSRGDVAATDMARSAFRANYGRPGRDTATVTPIVTLGTTEAGNRTVRVGATATINTFFIRALPQWRTMTVSDDAQAIRANANIVLALDRSGSMATGCNLSNPDCSRGGLYLPSAVINFVNRFDDNIDRFGMASFASSVTNNLSISRPFKSSIRSRATLTWSGGTFAHGGLTNAFQMLNAVTIPSGQSALKVVVFFTDGMANMIQVTVPTSSSSGPCNGTTQRAWNFGGYSSGNNVAIYATNAPYTTNGQLCPSYMRNGDEPGGCPNAPTRCSGVNFPSVMGGSFSLTRPNITMEATNRCIAIANQMHTAGWLVYAVGLDASGLGPQQEQFLRKLANDPQSPTHNPNLPVGAAYTVGNGSDLQEAFQQVAADILLRLIE